MGEMIDSDDAIDYILKHHPDEILEAVCENFPDELKEWFKWGTQCGRIDDKGRCVATTPSCSEGLRMSQEKNKGYSLMNEKNLWKTHERGVFRVGLRLTEEQARLPHLFFLKFYFLRVYKGS